MKSFVISTSTKFDALTSEMANLKQLIPPDQCIQGCWNHGCCGCKCTPCLLHFQLCGCSAGADYGCNGCTKLLQQTELNVARGSVWGVLHPPVVRNSAKLLSIWRKVKRKALLMEVFARNYGGIVAQ
jgi:hypothetical protein